MKIKNIDTKIIHWTGQSFVPLARIAIFIIYFYFGVLKLLNQSPASPLALALTAQTIGISYFNIAFKLLAVYECIVGILFLIPRATRIVIPMLLLHLLIVCSPLILVPHLAWVHPFIPTLEGQYIIKNVLLIALAIGLAAHARPLALTTKHAPNTRVRKI
ncbi:MAG: hypothetical protein NVSMB46_06090 [Candidatus Saccharimonadales bacterium]